MIDDTESDKEREEILRRFRNDRKLALRVLFKHRHPDATPQMHDEIIDEWASDHKRSAVSAFRGGAKSTLFEETTLLDALFEDFKFGVLVGESHGRACDRLEAIKYELDNNEFLRELFQLGTPKVWAQDEIVLSTGCKIIALGAGMAVRGVKKGDQRPDYIGLDDVENEESVATAESRRKRKRWFYGTLLPIRDVKKCKIKIIGSILHPEGLMAEVMKDPKWHPKVYPIKYIDPDTGYWMSTWEARYSLEQIDEIEEEYNKVGAST